MSAYYNEIDPYAAEWLQNLIVARLIAPGDIDQRDIRDVRPSDLRGYAQCHFFAGSGGWSLALRLAGWPDDRPVWTGSCPCQPFSSAGRQIGFDDERHLWPSWHWLIGECRPPIVLGEQVASGPATSWLDLVSSDLEALGYAFGAAALPACGVGAPHIRQRTGFVADRISAGLSGADRSRGARVWDAVERHGAVGTLADAMHTGRAERWPIAGDRSAAGSGGASLVVGVDHEGPQGWIIGRDGADQRPVGSASLAGGMGEPNGSGWSQRQSSATPLGYGRAAQPTSSGPRLALALQGGTPGADEAARQAQHRSVWSELEWLPCRDGKARPTQPGLFPLAHGVSGRVGKLRAYGNAIVPQVAAEFIGAYLKC